MSWPILYDGVDVTTYASDHGRVDEHLRRGHLPLWPFGLQRLLRSSRASLSEHACAAPSWFATLLQASAR